MMGCQGYWGEETDPLRPSVLIVNSSCPHTWMELEDDDPSWQLWQCCDCGALKTEHRLPEEGCCG